MKHASYRAGVEWIALNDEPDVRNWVVIEGFVTTMLLADLFDKPARQVALDIADYRFAERHRNRGS